MIHTSRRKKKNAWEGDRLTDRRTDVATTRPNRPSRWKLVYTIFLWIQIKVKTNICEHYIFLNPDLRWKPTSVNTLFSDLKPRFSCKSTSVKVYRYTNWYLHQFFLKGIDTNNLVEIVILRYDHWPQFVFQMSVVEANDQFFFIIFKYLFSL